MIIKNHILKDKSVTFQKSPNHGAEFGDNNLDTIITHYTAGSSVESSVRTLCDPKSRASAHLVIGRNGSIFQLVPFNIIAWHAGKSSFQGRHGFNKYSIGIEIDNAGKLSQSGNGYVSWFGKVYEANEILMAAHKNESVTVGWQLYTESQLDSVREVCSLLIDTYGIRNILGHDEVAPNRKIDPGPAFPIDKFREQLLSSDLSDEGSASPLSVANKGFITSEKLNCRSNPNIRSEIVSKPLTKGDCVDILYESNGWYKIESKFRAWVKKDFVRQMK